MTKPSTATGHSTVERPGTCCNSKELSLLTVVVHSLKCSVPLHRPLASLPQPYPSSHCKSVGGYNASPSLANLQADLILIFHSSFPSENFSDAKYGWYHLTSDAFWFGIPASYRRTTGRTSSWGCQKHVRCCPLVVDLLSLLRELTRYLVIGKPVLENKGSPPSLPAGLSSLWNCFQMKEICLDMAYWRRRYSR